MGFYRGPRVVTDGLVVALDAGVARSYPETGTLWKDISGKGNDATVDAAVTWANGALTFRASTGDSARTPYNVADGDFTVCIWWKDNGVITTFERLADRQYNTGWFLGRNSSSATLWGGGVQEGSSPYGIYLTFPTGQWNYIVSKREGTTHTLYGNGITNTISNTVSSALLPTNAPLTFGAYAIEQAAQSFGGEIAIGHYYNRALTAAEVLQNFEANRKRFGI